MAVTASRWLGALPALLLLSPTSYAFFIGLQLNQVLAVLCGFLSAIGLLSIIPLLDTLVSSRRQVLAVATAGLVCLAVGSVLMRPSSRHPKPDSLVYRLDTDMGKAQWESFDHATDPWTSKVLGASPRHGKLTYYGADEDDALIADAPLLRLEAPDVHVVSAKQEGNARNVEVFLTSVRKASWIHMVPDSEVTSATIDGEDVQISSPKNANDKHPSWAFNLFGYNETGVKLTLKLKGQSCSALLVDEKFGLPALTEPRPAERMAWEGSDYTLVTRRVSLC